MLFPFYNKYINFTILIVSINIDFLKYNPSQYTF